MYPASIGLLVYRGADQGVEIGMKFDWLANLVFVLVAGILAIVIVLAGKQRSKEDKDE